MNKKEIIVKYIKGENVRDLAKEYGVSKERIYQILRKDPMWKVWKKKHFCAKHKRRIEALVRAKTYKELALIWGISLSSVYTFLKRLVRWGCVDEKELERLRMGWRKKTLAFQIVQLKKKGLRNVEIAKLLNVSIYYVGLIVWKARKKGILPKILEIEQI